MIVMDRLRIFVLLLACLVLSAIPLQGGVFRSGIDVLDASDCRALKGKKVALITNAAGVTVRGESNYAMLLRNGISLSFLMAPEHGFAVNVEAGKKTGGSVIGDTLRVHSLYGASKKPSVALLKTVDLVVFDLQDVGARCYTYISTMKLAMEACMEAGVPFMVLDRPNPVAPLSPSGFMLDKGYESFVGAVAVPFVHAMTVGEIALLLKKSSFQGLDLQVVKMEGYRRELFGDELPGFAFVSPSPNIRNIETAVVYPATVMLEATAVSEGRGTDAPFLQFGAPFIDSTRLLEEVKACRLPGVEFFSVSFIPKSGKFRNEQCFGLKLRVSDRKRFSPFTTSAALLLVLQKLYPSSLGLKSGGVFFDRLAGTPRFREMILEQVPVEVIVEASRNDVREFQRTHPARFIYP
ncbi:MAG: DUF1343 domain-containing protein [Chlorobium limicola]|uniref:exo-beta-N-acetylmuramidase NamZ family protein n=1 Tax=Chlorobium limicola TaxID=1092 RepID=UPI0023F4804C|nr:DUF1343 domain-containing protein [Chlorobium limicola]NTV20820.1 DUF1343 domain-containing protein [Chlorobium limicola]